MKNVLIIGGLGYVGQALIDILQAHDDLYIDVLDNCLAGGIPAREDINFIAGDICSQELLMAVMPKYDTIIHLAAIVGEPACIIDPSFAFAVNVRGTANISRALLPHQHLIFASSSSVYGKRDNNEIVYEYSHVNPINHYSQHKVHGEQYIQLTVNNYTIFRPATAFGITKNPRLDILVNTLIFEALTTGKIVLYEPEIIRPMVYVYDYAKALEAAIYNESMKGQIYNLGDPRLTMTKRELVSYIADICKVPIEQTNNTSLDQRNYNISVDKIIQTGFTFSENTLFDTIEDIQYSIGALIRNKNNYIRANNVLSFLYGDKPNVYRKEGL